ncbi:MAG: HlyD family secretion protein [Bacteroidota bacterium]
MEANETPKKKKNVLPFVLLAIAIIGGYIGYRAYSFGKHHIETDDAQIDGNIAPVLPRTAGYVQALPVVENQAVKAGELLVRLDSDELKLKVEQSEAALNNAIANVELVRANVQAIRAAYNTATANLGTARADIQAAEVTANKNAKDFERSASLLKEKSISQQAYDNAEAARQSSDVQVETNRRKLSALQAQAEAAKSQVAAAERQVAVAEAAVEQRKSDLNLSKLQLGYSEVRAPITGRVSRKNVQFGQYVSQGQSLMSIVQEDSVWATANFKETQIGRMAPGMTVKIEVDAYPDHDFEGVIHSFSGATGSKFALLPPDNATGNFVKVVQRVPVKILITSKPDPKAVLRAGMNINAVVNLD